MNSKISSAWAWCRRYLSPATVVAVLALAYIIFSGEHNVFRAIDNDRRIDSLKAVLTAERDTMLYYKSLNDRIDSDRDLIERVVREQYRMKRLGEEVFIFTDNPSDLESNNK